MVKSLITAGVFAISFNLLAQQTQVNADLLVGENGVGGEVGASIATEKLENLKGGDGNLHRIVGATANLGYLNNSMIGNGVITFLAGTKSFHVFYNPLCANVDDVVSSFGLWFSEIGIGSAGKNKAGTIAIGYNHTTIQDKSEISTEIPMTYGRATYTQNLLDDNVIADLKLTLGQFADQEFPRHATTDQGMYCKLDGSFKVRVAKRTYLKAGYTYSQLKYGEKVKIENSSEWKDIQVDKQRVMFNVGVLINLSK